MNNKGWGLSTLFGFLAVFGIFLIIVSILYNKNFSNINNYDEEDEKTEKPLTEYEITSETEKDDNDIDEKKYYKLEENLINSSKKYINLKKLNNVSYKVIVTMTDLKEENLIDDLIDPRNNHSCSGYVIYDNNKYNPYINCNGSYQTTNYDDELE